MLPKYFVIKSPGKLGENNPLWKKYIKWLNTIQSSYAWEGQDYNTYYGRDGHRKEYGGTYIGTNLDSFENSPVEITLEEWDIAVNSPEELVYNIF